MLVGRLGVEPSTSFLSGKRSTAEPAAQEPPSSLPQNVTKNNLSAILPNYFI